MRDIKFIVFDVDGTLTDGKIYISANGELMKAFHIKDGYGIAHLKDRGINPIIITGRTSEIVIKRCEELGITQVYQGIKEKKEFLMHLYDRYSAEDPLLSLDNFAYMGDDLIDLECMQICGLAGCPKDAVDAVREKCAFISRFNGGEGAARDFIDWILNGCLPPKKADKKTKDISCLG